MRVFFRTDSNLIIGGGHLARCLNLAEAMSDMARRLDTSVEIFFIGKGLEKRIPDKYKLFSLQEKDDFPLSDDTNTWLGRTYDKDVCECLKFIYPFNKIDLLIVDHYGIEEKWERQLSMVCNKILVIDDLANRKHFCHYLVDATPYPEETNPYLDTKKLVPRFCRCLLGPKYALLNSTYRTAGCNTRIAEKNLRFNILITFGSADLRDQTIKVLESIISEPELPINQIIVICGSHYQRLGDLISASFKNDNHYKIEIYRDIKPEEMPTYYNISDVCIGGSGVSAFERCSVGLPSILITVAKNQEQIALNLDRLGAAIYLGDWKSWDSQKLHQAIWMDHDKLTSMHEKGLKVVDSLGCRRVVGELLGTK